MSQIRIVPPGGGEIIGDSPQRRVEILSDADPLHATISRFGPGLDGADLHVHTRHSDLFYVLEGELTVRLGVEDEQVVVPAGALARVPPNVVHGFRNASEADMRYLNFHAPGCDFANYMRSLRDGRKLVYDQYDPPADGGRPISEAVVEPAARRTSRRSRSRAWTAAPRTTASGSPPTTCCRVSWRSTASARPPAHSSRRARRTPRRAAS